MKSVTKVDASKGKSKKLNLPSYLWWHFLAVLFIYVFCTFVLGDLFQRAQQDCYVSSNMERMTYIMRQPLGWYYWGMRYMMLAYKNMWIGGAVMTILLVGSACCLSRALKLTHRWKLLSFLLPFAMLGYFIWRGTRMYFLDEPSLVMGIPFAVLLLTVIIAIVLTLTRRKGGVQPASKNHPHAISALVVILSGVVLVAGATVYRENDIVCARMQNNMLEADWESIADDALHVNRGSRSIAAYYAISLVQQNRLLEGLFDYAFDYPQDGMNLSAKGSTEAGLYEADCNFYAGLVNAAYRVAMDRHVMAGPSIYNYKRMALCGILNGETQLAKRYLKALEDVPFESDFVERYAPMVDDPNLILNDPELVNVLSLAPRETNYEQMYRRPIFLGYNVGLTFGSDATLITSIASTLYSKDLMRFMNMATVLRQKTGGRLPAIVRQAILVYSMTHDEVKNVFPEVCNDRMLVSNFQAFVAEAKPYLKDKVELRKRMKDNWLGTYYYYYYCENNEPYQVRKVDSSAGGVN